MPSKRKPSTLLSIPRATVKSRFIEMFDSEKFELAKLGDYCERVTKGATPTTLGYHYQDNGINFIKVESLAENGSIVADKVAHISDECNEAMRRSQLRVGDIVFSIAGAIGRTAIIPDSILPANTNQALAIIRLRSPLAFDRIFLRYALISSDVTRSISSSKRGIAQVNLSLTDIKNLRVPLPPLALQQEFANFVSRVDKLRFEACYAMYFLCAAFTLLWSTMAYMSVVSIFACPKSRCTCSMGMPLSIAFVASVRRNLCG